MKKITKIRLCDWLLIILTFVTLISSVQLEVTGSFGTVGVFVHIIVASLFFIFIAWHLFLHFQWRNWIKALYRQKSPVTHWLTVFCVFTLISAIFAVTHWISSGEHSVVGAVHGKIGFIFIILAICHTLKRIKSPILFKR